MSTLEGPGDQDEDNLPPAPLPSMTASEPSADPEPNLPLRVACDERERLLTIYLASVTLLDKMAGALGESDSSEWQTGTRNVGLTCEAALTALNDHRRQHGC
jgi:hypothetical protein